MKKIKNENNNASQLRALVESSAPEIQELKYGDGENAIAFKVYPVLPFTKRTEMIREIVNGVFMDEKNTVHTYAPEFLTLLQKYTVIKFFTDLSLPAKLDDMWLVLNYTYIYDDVVQIIGIEEVNKIFEAANKAIDTYRKYLTTKTDINALMNKVSGALSDIESKIPNEDIAAITSKIKDMTKGSSMQDLIGALLGNKDVQG